MIKRKRMIRESEDREFREKVYNAIDLISGPAADKYFDLLVDVAERAIANVEHRGHEDLYDAAWSAIDEGMIYYDDQWLIMRYFQSPGEANLQEAFESMAEDIVKVLESLVGTGEEDEDLEESRKIRGRALRESRRLRRSKAGR